MFDTTIAPIDIKISIPEDKSHLRLVLVTGIMIPIGEQIGQVPTGQYQAPIGKDQAIRLGEALIEAAEQLEDIKPHVETASSMAQADAMAKQEALLKKLTAR